MDEGDNARSFSGGQDEDLVYLLHKSSSASKKSVSAFYGEKWLLNGISQVPLLHFTF